MTPPLPKLLSNSVALDGTIGGVINPGAGKHEITNRFNAGEIIPDHVVRQMVVTNQTEIDAAFAAVVQLHAGALTVVPDAFFAAGASNSSHRYNGWPFRESITCVNSSLPGV